MLVFLFFTQKCRVVYEVHVREIEEYRQRKNLYKEFETDELFNRTYAEFERRKGREQEELNRQI